MTICEPGQIGSSVCWASVSLLSAQEAALVLRISVKTVHKLVRENKLSCVQVTARERRFTHEQVQEYIRSQSTEVRVDKKATRPVQSLSKKGDVKSAGVYSTSALREEMRQWR
jgi:excisionase family DNA binding protein